MDNLDELNTVATSPPTSLLSSNRDSLLCQYCEPIFELLSLILRRSDLVSPAELKIWLGEVGVSRLQNDPRCDRVIVNLRKMDELRQSACQMCLLFYEAVRAAGSRRGFEVPDNGQVVLKVARNRLFNFPGASMAYSITRSLCVQLYREERANELPLLAGVEPASLKDEGHVRKGANFTSDTIARLSPLTPDLDAGFGRYVQHGTVPRSFIGGARLRPAVCNTKLFSRWLSLCEKHHRSACTRSKYKFTAIVRLLNIYTMRIAPASPQMLERYCILSYVWGSKQHARLTSKSISDQGTASFDVGNEFHPAIVDAIRIVRQLGEQYLWVDSLCIIQDCEEDKVAQIAQMGAIYHNSILTIVAAGSQRDALGLPGVSSVRQNHVPIRRGGFCIVPELSQLEFDDGGGAIPGCRHWTANSFWATRAWTFQEFVLSPRRLVFADDQARWICQSSQWDEDCHLEDENAIYNSFKPVVKSWSLDRYNLTQGLTGPKGHVEIDVFIEAMEYFSKLEISHVEDRLSSLQGILNALDSQKSQIHFLWALSSVCFEKQFSWMLYSTPNECGRHYDTFLNLYPSWSWLSCSEPVIIRSFYKPVLKCFSLLQDEKGRILCRPVSSSAPLDTNPQDQQPDEISFELTKPLLPCLGKDLSRYIVFWADVAELVQAENAFTDFLLDVNPSERCEQCSGNTSNGRLLVVRMASWTKSNASQADTRARTCSFLTMSIMGTSIPGKPCAFINLMAIKWKDGIAYRAGQGFVRDCYWKLVKKERQLIIMG